MLSSATDGRAPGPPQADSDGKEPPKPRRDGNDRVTPPAGGPGVEPPQPAAPLEGDYSAEELGPIDDFGEAERVASGDDAMPAALDDAVEDESPRRGLVADHVPHADLRRGGRHDMRDVTVSQKGEHAPAPGLDPQALPASEQMGG
jgi:hypothetical protein